MERKVVFKERLEATKNHPEKTEIFWLEQMLMEAGYPYFFNFWEELRPVFGGEDDGDPESIDWDNYKFLIELGHPAGDALSQISVCFNTKGDPKLLELLDMRPAAGKQCSMAEDGTLHCGLSAEDAMEIINDFFKTA